MTQRAEVDKRRRRVLKLYDSGLSQVQIAKRLEMPRATVALDLKSSPGYVPRTTLASFEVPPGRITAAEAAKRHGLTKLQTLLDAIEAGIVRGKSETLAGGRVITTVDMAEFAEDMANLPACGYPGCERQALAPSGACSGAHARALETMGQSWRTPEAIAKSASGIRGKPRPDVRERDAAMHADPAQHYAWANKTMAGRARIGRVSAQTVQRWAGRDGGLQAAKRAAAAGTIGRPAGYTEAQRARVEDLRGKGLSIRAISRVLNLSKDQVQRIARDEVSRKPL